jgi:hypothetical protein
MARWIRKPEDSGSRIGSAVSQGDSHHERRPRSRSSRLEGVPVRLERGPSSEPGYALNRGEYSLVASAPWHEDATLL